MNLNQVLCYNNNCSWVVTHYHSTERKDKGRPCKNGTDAGTGRKA